MAEKMQKNRKRKHFEIEKNRQSPFQNYGSKRSTSTVVSKAPRGINVTEFAESRALEIQNMMLALTNASETSNKRVFQSIPRHMRRRAASHNSKRMPVRLRDAYNREAAKSQEKMKDTKKKPSRRQRRKPSNLLEEYNRRQRKHVWLETHIWHAKRFKMAEHWGYKIPLHPNDKSVRASYRAMATGCLMQDISYYQCVEVSGQQGQIVTAMAHLTNSGPGLTMAAKQFLNGSLEGHVILYECDKYPCNAIGPVRFLWQQLISESGTDNNVSTNEKGNCTNAKGTSKLWVWSHPACRDDVSREIIRACSLEGRTKTTEEQDIELDTNSLTEVKEPEVLPQSEASEEPCDFIVSVFKEQLIRFRLTGPKSHPLLASTLELCDWRKTKEGEGQSGPQWWQQYSKEPEWHKSLTEQNALWEQMKTMSSPGLLTGGSVISLVVKDPRLGLPLRKSNVDMASEGLYQEENIGEPAFTRCPVGSAVSPIWDMPVRKEVKQSKIPEKDLNERRSKMIVPGSKVDLGSDESRIPILVIQRPGTRGDAKSGSIDFGCGYDLIIPAGWSMAFWIALVYRGARVGGSRELATCSREQAMPHFPRDFPDTRAGREFNEDLGKAGREKYAKYPPAKRPNYAKLGVVSPFCGDWGRLVEEWSEENGKLETEMRDDVIHLRQENVCDSRGNVVRGHANISRDDMVSLPNTIVTICHKVATSRDKAVPPCDEMVTSRDETATSRDEQVISRDEAVTSRDVQVTSRAKIVTPSPHGTGDNLELPTNHTTTETNDTVDGTKLSTDPSSSVNSSRENYIVDRSCTIRRRLGQIIQDLQTASSLKNKANSSKVSTFRAHLDFLRTSLVSSSRVLLAVNLLVLSKGCPLPNAIIFIPTPEDLRALARDKNYSGPVEEVHKSGKNGGIQDLRSHSLITNCSRKAIGFVSSGEYSFARGRGSAVGFCAFPGICELVLLCWREKSRPLVLVRNPTSFQYRFASLRFV